MNSLTTIRPVSPAAGYIGGKRNLASRLVPIIDAINSPGYAEPCVGMGGIFLRRRVQAKREFINDISGDVATFFRCAQEHYEYFIDMLRFRVASRAEFDRLNALPPERLTDLQRATRFLYLQRLAFGGKVAGRNFGVSAGQGARFNVPDARKLLEDIHARLERVTIEQLPYQEFIRRYDRADMLFYIDPPYAGSEEDYGKGVFAPDDHGKLADQLRAIDGRVIVSINDTAEIREIYSGFRMRAVDVTYTVATAQAGAKKVGELIISNFDLP